AIACTGAAWHHAHWSLYPAHEIGLFAGDTAVPAALELRATAGPRRIPAPPYDPLRTIPGAQRTRVEVEALAIRDGEAWRPAAGRTTLIVDGDLVNVHLGDRLLVYGQVLGVRGPSNPGDFDFARAARANRRHCTLRAEFPECVMRVPEPAHWAPLG